MFKFKMSLLLNNLKFRVAIVVLVIAAIVAGIICIPKNKASKINTSLTSNDIIAQSCKLIGKSYWTNPGKNDGFEDGWGKGVTNGRVWGGNSGTRKYGTDFKLADINSFSSVDCTGLIYYTLTSLGCSTSGFNFQNPVPVDTKDWYNHTNPKITYKGTTTDVNVLKKGVPVESLPYYMCENGTEIPAGSIVIAAGSKLNSNNHDHGWIYLGNLGTVDVKEVAKILIKDMGVNANLLITGDINGNFNIKTYVNGLGKTVPVIQKTDNTSTYWRIESTADSNGYGVYINNGNPRTASVVMDQNTGKKKAIGPIYAFQIANVPEVVKGNYNVVLKKVKADGTTVITSSEAIFKINGNEKSTTKGILNISNAKEISDEKQVDTYEIIETSAPEGFNLFSGTIKLDVKFKKEGNKYLVDNANTTCTGLPENAKFEINSNTQTITICVPNNEQPRKSFDLALRKYISKINGKDVEPSREPVINKQSIKMLEKTGTASYYHAKNSLSVRVGDEIEYTIRVYNEGEILSFAKQITDYLPEGLSFVKLSDDNSKEFTTTSEVGSKVVVINYNGNTLIKTLRDFIGKEVKVNNEYYQEVKMICKVENTDKVYITNRAEITNYGYNEKDENGQVIWKEAKALNNVDKDSIQNTIKNALKLDTWYENAKENTYVDENGKTVVDKNYYPGVQDDDDFETVELLTGKYSIVIRKIDSTDSKKVLQGAQFTVKGSNIENEKILKPTDVNGHTMVVSGVAIQNEKQVDTYTIKETKAPQGYKLFDGEIKVKVATKFDGTNFVIDNEKTTVNGENITYSVNSDNTIIGIVVTNEKKDFDLALRKFITKVNGKELAESREPVINEKSILMLEKTGTASYYHAKNSISVIAGDEIEYTLRVYNEGNILGFAKQITDYLPEGLSFVKLSDENSKEFTTTSEVGSNKVVINYSGNTLIKTLRDFIGKEVKVTNEYYQEVKLICKVENIDKLYITNRAEITNYGYNEKDENEKVIWKEAKEINDVDKDSVQDTIKSELNLDTWYEKVEENTYVDENGKTVVDTNYYPGVEDDDDFETVELLTGKYSIVINKVDATDSKKVLQGAQFTVKGSNIENETTLKPTNEKGNTVVVSGVVIQNEKQVDSYTIKETQAPKDYKLLDGEIKVKVATKFNGTSFVIDSKNTTVDGKNIKFSVDENNTTISIVVANEKKSFDLALRKFITEVNGKELAENRAPQVDVSKLVNGTAKTATYNHSKVPVNVNTTDIVTYTIRVYNEGELDGYASKIMDDVPEGLVFVPATFDENGKPTNTNAEYGWTLYREAKADEKVDSLNSIKYNGKTYVVTDKVEEAEVIVTDYLSKENGENNLMKAFDSTTMKQLDYKDVKVAFKVIEPTTSDRVIVNYAQITEHTDSDGNPTIVDRDSTPNEWKDKEDDQDIEKIKVRYFDLSLLKWVTKAIVYENGVETVTETGHTGYENPEPIVKVDLKDTSINDVVVKFEYTIRITNDGDKGQIAGYAKEISDYIPEGLKFDPADNPEWKEVDGKIVTRALENTLLKPGEFADVTVILTWINGQDNLGLKTNIAEISEDYNEFGTPDIDSVPNNKVPDEDDIDDAPVMLSIRTGRPIVYTGLAVGVLSIISLGAVVIRKRVL